MLMVDRQQGDNLALDPVFIAFSPDDAATKKVADGVDGTLGI
jgi:hypothetical protein